MKTLKLLITARDIKETEYLESFDCAITRALERAGKSHLIDEGTSIWDKDSETYILDDNNESYREMRDYVQDMYSHKFHKRFSEIKDKEFIINY